MLDVFGLAHVVTERDEAPDGAALALLAEREAARAARDWEAADRLRDELRAQGWDVRDGADGAELVRSR